MGAPGRDLSAELYGNTPPAATSNGGRDLSGDLYGGAQAQPLSRLDRIGKGMMDPIDGGAQLLAHILPDSVVQAGNKLNNWLADKTGLVAKLPDGGVDKLIQQNEQAYQARRQSAGQSGFDGYRTLGNVVSPANLAIGAGEVAAPTLLGRVAQGAGMGAESAMLNPVTDGSDYLHAKVGQAAAGAVGGAAVPAVTGGIARVISPNASRNPNLQLLKGEGVNPTIGQTLGGRWNALEEKAQSIPVMGDAIALARQRAMGDFNNAAINRATAPIGANVDGAGQAAVRDAGDAISEAYDNALGKITGVQLDPQFNTQLMQLRGMAQGLTTTMRNKFNTAINDTLLRKVSPNGGILPDDYKAIDSELGNLASRYGKSPVASEQEFGDAVSQLQSLLNQQMRRSNPQIADELRAADTAWANLVRVEGAAKSAKNAEGVFTPAQLNMAAQAADGSVRKRAVARGTALMQDLGNAGQSVIGNKVPNSFTTDRALIAGGALSAGLVNPMIPAGLLGGAAMYLPAVQKLLVNMASTRPGFAQPAANAFRNAAPMAAPAAGQIGAGLLSQ